MSKLLTVYLHKSVDVIRLAECGWIRPLEVSLRGHAEHVFALGLVELDVGGVVESAAASSVVDGGEQDRSLRKKKKTLLVPCG